METSKNIPSINKTEQALGQRSAHGKKKVVYMGTVISYLHFMHTKYSGRDEMVSSRNKKEKGEIKFVLLLKKGQNNHPALQLVIARCHFLSTLKSGGTCSLTCNYRIRGHTAKPQYWHLVLEK